MDGLVAEWIQKAQGDFNVAQRELRVRLWPNYDACCFHAQQRAEKYLKDFLVSRKVEPPRTHNLVDLLATSAAQDEALELIRGALELLNAYAVDIRYPGESATKEEAREAVKAMKQVREFRQSRLGRAEKKHK
jgi:HEPN domain-containing protein